MPVEMITGSQAAATAVQRAGVDLVVAYPITPQTAIVETLAEYWARGELGGEYVNAESEYASLAYCSGAASAGARTFTATSSHGLAYMHEMIHWCAGARHPIVLANVNRAMGAPWCLEPDQIDSLSQRDTGWIQLYCANAQEVFDTILQAFALAESVLLPCMVVFDGFYVSHTYEAVDIPPRDTVARFLGPSCFAAQVDPGRPANLHGLIGAEAQSRLVLSRHRAMERVWETLREINDRFAALFGRSYPAVEGVACEGAKTLLVTAGSCAETIKSVLPALDGTGLLRLKAVRPFPARELRTRVEASGAETVIVVDRNCSPGLGGILAQEVKAALYGAAAAPPVQNLILAGGVDLTPWMLKRILDGSLFTGGGGPDREVWGVDLA
jgi:pyruvate/2-oxoacid:ferredoxin oxidoreductase alpha subunit